MNSDSNSPASNNNNNNNNNIDEKTSVDTELSALNVEYKQLHQRQDALHALAARLRQEETCLHQALEACQTNNNHTNTSAPDDEETRALRRLQQVLFAADEDDGSSDDEEDDDDNLNTVAV